MLGAVTRSFINTEPGALWELPACPLSALAAEMQVCFVCLQLVCICWTRGSIIFYGCLIEREQIMRLLVRGCGCVNANMCVFLSWQVCVSRGIRSQASPRGVRGPVTSKGRGARCASQPAKGEILFMWRGLAWQDRWLTPQPGACTDCHHPGRFKS